MSKVKNKNIIEIYKYCMVKQEKKGLGGLT